MAYHWIFAVVLLWQLPSVLALPAIQAQTACRKLAEALPNKVHLPGTSEYQNENANYWNSGLSELGPTCIAMPESTDEVVTIVKTLNEHDRVPFAIKSGGHSPNQGQSSVKDGVLIALGNLKGTTYDPKTQLATMKPGGRWSEAIDALAPTGRTVVGGRLGNIGIGGLVSQGGLSFLSTQYGLAADNIVEWEVVLANGTVANIKMDERPDLATAMRGSGNQFGIITKFVARTYVIGEVWVGMRVFTYGQRDRVFAALADFLENNHKDPKAAIIFDAGYGTNKAFTATVLMVYAAPEPPKGAFRQFEDIHTVQLLGTPLKYATAVRLTNPFIHYLSSRTSFRSFTLPHQPDNHEFYKLIDDTWTEVADRYIKDRWNIFLSVTYQPLSNIIGAASEARGGNAMGLTGNDHNRLVLELTTLWREKADDDLVSRMNRDITDAIQMKLDSARRHVNGSSKATIGEYNPFFMNDAAADQDVTGSYKNAARFAQLQKDMDPQGFWSRTGGFRYKM